MSVRPRLSAWHSGPGVLAGWLAATLAGAACPAAGAGPATERVSIASPGNEGNGPSWLAAISAAGRFVAFESAADNLVPDDTNNARDIFVHDRQSGQTTRVSLASDGSEADDDSFRPSISADGRFVAFYSQATNLVADDTNGLWDVFVHDRQTGLTVRASLASDGAQADGASIHPFISGNGRFVVFHSFADNLVAGDTNAQWDVFVRDLQAGQTTRVSVDSAGRQGNDWSEHAKISSDGWRVVFHSLADNLVPGDSNGVEDVFLHDRQTGQTLRVSVDSNGTPGDGPSIFPAISPDGRYVAFESQAGNLVADDTNGLADIFVHDLLTGETYRASRGADGAESNGASYRASISTGGRYVAFWSHASNLVPDDPNGAADVFIHLGQAGRTARISIDSGCGAGNGFSLAPAISPAGRYVAFQSFASNLVPDDNNRASDVFVRDWWIPGDLDTDFEVDQQDLSLLLSDWGCADGACPGDLDGDGDTDQSDLATLLAHYAETCR